MKITIQQDFEGKEAEKALNELNTIILEEKNLQKVFSERIKIDDPRVQAILDRPYTPQGEKKLAAADAPDSVLRAYRAGTTGPKGFLQNLWDDSGDYWANVGLIEKPEDLGHLILDIVGMIPIAGVPADLANFIWYAYQGRYLYAGLSLFAALPIAGYIANSLKLGTRGATISAKVAARASEHLPTFVRAGSTAVANTKVVSAGMWSRISRETSEFITRAARAGTEGLKAGPRLIPPRSATDIAIAATAQVEKATGKTFARAARTASAEAFEKTLQKNVGKEGLAGAAVLARTAKETVEKEMAAAAAKIPRLVRSISIRGSTGYRRKGTRELARQVFLAGGDYKTLNTILKTAGSTSTAKTIIAGTKTLKGEAAKEFLELAAKAGATKPATLAGVRVTTSYMKKYNVRQFKRAGILTVKYDVLSHIIGDDTIEDDPLKPPKPVPDDGPRPSPKPRGRWRSCPTNLKMGCGGKNVEELQTLLNKYYAKAISAGESRGLKVDGKFGNNTSNTVINFQRQHKLKADGIAGEETMKKLRELTAGTATTTGEEPPPPTVGADLLTQFQIDSQLTNAGLSVDKDQKSFARAGLELARLQYKRQQPLSPEEIKKTAQKYIANPVRESKQGINKVLSEHRKKVNEKTFNKLVKGL
mgnify:CR=1 FL=1